MDGVEAARSAGLDAHARRDWPTAYATLEADREHLSADEWYALSDAAWWLGHVDESIDAGDRAYRGYLADGRPRGAALAALSNALNLLLRGDDILGSGWIARCRRLLAAEHEGPEHGYLLYVTEVLGAIDQLVAADDDAVSRLAAAARRVERIGRDHTGHWRSSATSRH